MILLIDNYDSFTYNIYQYLKKLDQDVQIEYNDKINVEKVRKIEPEKIIISPGPKRPEDSGNCLKIIKAFYQEIPILGICLGHQCIAQAFGAKIIYAKEVYHGRYSMIKHNQKDLFNKLSNPLQVARYHSLAIKRDTLPDIFEITAKTEDDEIMAIKHKTLPLYGVQFHPESIFTPEGLTLLNNFLVDD